MADNPYNGGKITNAGTQVIAPLHKQPSAKGTVKITGTDLRGGSGKG